MKNISTSTRVLAAIALAEALERAKEEHRYWLTQPESSIASCIEREITGIERALIEVRNA